MLAAASQIQSWLCVTKVGDVSNVKLAVKEKEENVFQRLLRFPHPDCAMNIHIVEVPRGTTQRGVTGKLQQS